MNLKERLLALYRVGGLLDKNARNINDSRASGIIHSLFDQGTVLPFTTFSINPNTILHLLNELMINKRTSVVEFGSGLSTLVLARFIQLNQLEAEIVSVESDGSWLQFVQDQLKVHNCNHGVNLVHAPISTYQSKEHTGKWYDTESLDEYLADKEFDMVVVDGPGAGLCRNSRFPAFPYIKDKLKDSYFVLLDDTRRNDERDIFERWVKMSGAKEELNPKEVYATFSVGSHFSSRPLGH